MRWLLCTSNTLRSTDPSRYRYDHWSPWPGPLFSQKLPRKSLQPHHGHDEKRPELKQSHGTKSETMRTDPLCGSQVRWTTPLEHATAFSDTFQLPTEPKLGPYRMTHFWRTTTSNYARILIAGSSISRSYPNYPSEDGLFKYCVLRISLAYKGCKIVILQRSAPQWQRRITKVPKRWLSGNTAVQRSDGPTYEGHTIPFQLFAGSQCLRILFCASLSHPSILKNWSINLNCLYWHTCLIWGGILLTLTAKIKTWVFDSKKGDVCKPRT